MQFTPLQYEKLSELCLDIAKALYIGALAIPVVFSSVTFFRSIYAVIVASFFMYLSIAFIKRKEDRYDY